jgi:branched-chain amino acid transport system substrate-binding protein
MKRYLCVVVALIMTILTILTGCSTTSSSTESTTTSVKTLIIGDVEPLTGPISDITKLSAEGTALAEEYINQHGGITIDGQKYLIKIDSQDSGLSSDQAVTAAQDLISKGVKFIVGEAPSFLIRAVNSVTEPAGVVYVCLNNSGGDELGSDDKFTFLPNDGCVPQAIAVMNYLKELHPETTNIAVALADDGQFEILGPKLKNNASSLGLNIIGDLIGWSNDTVDYAPTVQKLLALNPDAIVLGNASSQAEAAVLKIARESGYDKPICGASLLAIEDVLTIAGPEVATNFIGISFTKETSDLPEVTREVWDMAEAKYGKADMIQLQGFNAVYELVQAIQAANSLYPEVVRDTWERMDTMDTIMGTGTIAGITEFGIQHAVYTRLPLSRLENGTVSFGSWVDVSAN